MIQRRADYLSLPKARFDHHHIELQLSHLPRDQISAACNHATYLQQRRVMMQAWSDYLDGCLIVGISK